LYNTKRIHSSLGYLSPPRNGNQAKRKNLKSGLKKNISKLVGIPLLYYPGKKL